MSRQDIGYERSDNKIIWLSNFEVATKVNDKFSHIYWTTALMPLALTVNPLMDDCGWHFPTNGYSPETALGQQKWRD